MVSILSGKEDLAEKSPDTCLLHNRLEDEPLLSMIVIRLLDLGERSLLTNAAGITRINNRRKEVKDVQVRRVGLESGLELFSVLTRTYLRLTLACLSLGHWSHLTVCKK